MCKSLFEQYNRAAMIDSVVYMKMRALTSLGALKIKDVVVPSSLFVQVPLGGKGVEQHQPQELEQRKTTVHPVLSKLFLSVQAHDCDMRSVQAAH